MKIKEYISAHREVLKHFLQGLIFVILFLIMFTRLTNLFRNADTDRQHIIGLEKEDNIDVLFIGGSSAFVFWEPLKAWNDCGFTSYNYATNSQPLDGPEYYLKEALKSTDPKLVVIEMRSFSGYEEMVYEPAIRNGADSMDWFSLNRLEYINSYLSNHKLSEGVNGLSLYLDIIKYHANHANLSNPTAWRFSDNLDLCDNKGFEWVDGYDYIEAPTDFQTDERAKLLSAVMETLNSLLDFCDSKELNVLFVVSPEYVTTEDTAIFNTIGDTVTERGYKFVNTNLLYDEIGVDYSKDFYNVSHMNCFGAEKFTDYLEKFIVDNYDIADHRQDESYSKWNEDYLRFAEEEKTIKSHIVELQKKYDESLDYEQKLTETTDVAVWREITADSRYIVLSVLKGEAFSGLTDSDARLWDAYYSDDDIEGRIDGGELYKTVAYSVIGQSIFVDGTDYCRGGEGLNCVVIDSVMRRVVDSVTFVSKAGKLIIER